MERFWEIDSLRGAAIVMMVISNLVTDLLYFRLYDPGSLYSLWSLFAYATATLFILLVGVSLTLSRSQVRKNVWRYNAMRGLKIFCWGLAITAVTYLLMKEGYILFGVLHLIGMAVMISTPFLNHRELNLWLGAAAIAAGIMLKSFSFDFSWLLWLGFMPNGFYSVDYFPLIPWFGVVLIGIFLGNSLYPKGKRLMHIGECKNTLCRILSLLGRNSLKIYLIHQPILIGFLYLFAMH